MNIALILSGGIGTRLNSDIPKQYIEAKGRMIISYCLETFTNCNQIDAMWIVCADEWKDRILDSLKSSNLCCDKIAGFSIPGKTRQLSILNGLNDISAYVKSQNQSDNSNIVIIHDAARPNISCDLITRGLDSIVGHDGVMPAIPMKDTVYMCDENGHISSLLDRSKIYAGQAPEFFYLNKYLEANKALLPDKIYSINGSTEPAILAGLDVITIPGDESNYKITTSEDLTRFIGEVTNQ